MRKETVRYQVEHCEVCVLLLLTHLCPTISVLQESNRQSGPSKRKISNSSFNLYSFGSTKKLVVPAKWKSDASFVKFKSLERKDKALPSPNMEETGVECAPILEKSAVDESVLLMKFYPLSSGIARQLLTASDGSQLPLLFEVNEQEAAIIQYQNSSFIIGRSGTGIQLLRVLILCHFFFRSSIVLNSAANSVKMDSYQRWDDI